MTRSDLQVHLQHVQGLRREEGDCPDQPQELQPPEGQVQVFLRHHQHGSRNKPILKLK